MDVRATANHESWCCFENPILASIPVEIWQEVFRNLDQIDHESLYLTCRTFRWLLNNYPLMGSVGQAVFFGTYTLLLTSNNYLEFPRPEYTQNKVRRIGNKAIFEKWIQDSGISGEAIQHKEAIGNRLLILSYNCFLICLSPSLEDENECALAFEVEMGEVHGIKRIVEQNKYLYIEYYYSYGWHHHDGWNEEDGYEATRNFLIVLDSTTGAYFFQKNLNDMENWDARVPILLTSERNSQAFTVSDVRNAKSYYQSKEIPGRILTTHIDPVTGGILLTVYKDRTYSCYKLSYSYKTVD